MPAKKHDKGEELSELIYRRAREKALAVVRSASEKLDAVSEADAEEIKKGLRRILRLNRMPSEQAERVVDQVFRASRRKRVKIIEDAIIDAARAANGLDEQTFEALFGKEEAAPFVEAQSDSPSKKPPLRPLPSGSGDDSPETA